MFTDAMDPNPSGECECGCGETTPLSKQTRRGVRKGNHQRFVAGHTRRANPGPRYTVDPDTECWIWQRGKVHNGYGVATVGGGVGQGPAHRIFYERVHGPIPDGLDLDHLCRNRACVNPDHLEPVTRTENVRRGRATKLTVDAARTIRSSREAAKELAIRYGISANQVYSIRCGRSWREEEVAA